MKLIDNDLSITTMNLFLQHLKNNKLIFVNTTTTMLSCRSKLNKSYKLPYHRLNP